MKLEKAIELLQGSKFHIRGMFLSIFGEDVGAKLILTHIDEEHTLRPVDIEYTLKVVNAETLLNDIDIDLDKVTNEQDLLNEVNNSLCNIQEINSDGVERI